MQEALSTIALHWVMCRATTKSVAWSVSSNASISNSHATGRINGGASIGGLVGLGESDCQCA